MSVSDAIVKINETIDKYVTYHKEDWTEHDLPRVKKCRDYDSFLVCVRSTGVDTLFITGPCKSLGNQEWAEASVEQHTEKVAYCYYNGIKRRYYRIGRQKALEICRNSRDLLSEDYVIFSKERLKKREPELTLFEWLKLRLIERNGTHNGNQKDNDFGA